jgi:hypothetical protein
MDRIKICRLGGGGFQYYLGDGERFKDRVTEKDALDGLAIGKYKIFEEYSENKIKVLETVESL